MIYFELDDTGYAVDAAELAGVANSCPFVTYPGLPTGVLGMVQWSGKVFPIVDAFDGARVDLASATFLFSLDNIRGHLREIAIAVPGGVRVFFAESTVPPAASASPLVSAQLIDQDGNEAFQIKLAKVAETVARGIAPLPAGRRGGKKIAA